MPQVQQKRNASHGRNINLKEKISMSTLIECNQFSKKQPCQNCPYRKDAPLQLWHRSEFERLAQQEENPFGGIYQCHKKDGHVCVGWLIKQDENRFPNINLRLMMMQHKVDRTYLDQLSSPVPLYNTVQEMITSNYSTIMKQRKRVSLNLVWSKDEAKKKVVNYQKSKNNGGRKKISQAK